MMFLTGTGTDTELSNVVALIERKGKDELVFDDAQLALVTTLRILPTSTIRTWLGSVNAKASLFIRGDCLHHMGVCAIRVAALFDPKIGLKSKPQCSNL